MRIINCIGLASILAFVLGPVPCDAFCGVSSRRKLDPVLLTSSTNTVNLTTKDLRALCERAGVHERARKPCRQSVEVAGVLVESAWTGVRRCQQLMRYERWNCSLGKTRRKIMRRVFRETAFLQALSSASVTYVVSRACAQGRLTHCSCGSASTPSSSSSSSSPDEGADGEEDHLRVWRWGGCGDNVQHGTRFAEKLFVGGTRAKARRREASKGHVKGKTHSSQRSQDFKSRIDAHNALVGIMAVGNTAQETCKCHGVSGSCSMRTCWTQLPSFDASAGAIKRLYETADLAVTNNEARMNRIRVNKKKKRRKKAHYEAQDDKRPEKDEREGSSKNPLTTRTLRRSPARRRKSSKSNVGHPEQLVYLDPSPSFCLRGRYGPGTRGRLCRKGNCEDLCCGRGHDTSLAVLEEPCKCRVVWCCRVQCHNCSRTAEIYTCK